MAVVALFATGLTRAADVDWSGPFVGATLGGVHGKFNATTTTIFSPTGYFAMTSPPAIASVSPQKLSSNAFTEGIAGGYNWQFGKLVVVGATGSFDFMSLRDSASSTLAYPVAPATTFTVTHSAQTHWTMALRPQVGVAVGPALIYVTGGLSVTSVDYHAVFTDTFANARESGRINLDMFGWTAGVGAEYRLGQSHWSIKGEFLYADYGKKTMTTPDLTTGTASVATTNWPTNVFSHSFTFKTETLRIGANLRF